jgi:hypothetical protein
VCDRKFSVAAGGPIAHNGRMTALARLKTAEFHIHRLDTEVAERMRRARTDEYGNDLAAQVDEEGGSPCRHCLSRSKPGERLVLFSHSPFDVRNPYKEVGPIFVHADGCEPYNETGEWPADFSRVMLRAYDKQQCIITGVFAIDNAEDLITELLARDGVAFVDARSITHGCWLFRIERSA